MKHIYLIFSCIIFFSSKAQQSFIVQEKANVFYVNHVVAKGESVFQLARDYHVKPNLILKFNDMGNQTDIKFGQKLRIPLVETNHFRMGGLAEENGYAALMHEIDMGENKAILAKKFSVSESNLQRWNEGRVLEEGKQIIVGWVKYDKAMSKGNLARSSYKELSDAPVKAKVVDQPLVEKPQEEEIAEVKTTELVENDTRIVVDERQQKAERSQALNPRFIDPNAPKVASAPVRTSNKAYQRPTTPVKKEALAIHDDTHDAWYKLKNIFAGKKSKKEKKKNSEDKNRVEETDSTPLVKEATKPAASKSPISASVNNKPSSNTKLSLPAKSAPKVAPKPLPKPVQNTASKPNVSEQKQEKKSKNLWADFKSSFAVGKDKSKEENLAIAKPKPVKNDPNRDLRPEPKEPKESKTKNIWGDLKSSFKADKENPSDLKYRNAEPSRRDEKIAPKATNQKPKNITNAPKQTVATNNTKSISREALKNAPKVTAANTKIEEAPKEIEKSAAPDPVVRNEIKTLNLSKSSSGRAAYFFGGPSGGKFYVATNLASKGQVVKVVNPENGKFVMAEVISPLPSSDAAKGILLKLSDNAKLPLGQKNSSFNVKVNY